MAGGTEAFPDLGKHCQHSGCHQLDFLPFECDGCRKVFCLEHRSYKSHECPKSDHNSRKVIVCETCSTSIEVTGKGDEEEKKMAMEMHEKSGDCDPRKKKKPTCPVRRCRETLTFSNTTVCKTCRLKVCLKHRFPADHACGQKASADKLSVDFAARNGKDCAISAHASSSTVFSVKAC